MRNPTTGQKAYTPREGNRKISKTGARADRSVIQPFFLFSFLSEPTLGDDNNSNKEINKI